MGMMAGQRTLDVVSQNLANVGTTGYKRDGIAFTEALQRQMVTGEGLPLGTLGAGPDQGSEFTVLGEQGTLTKTGNPLDLAFESPNGMFAVQTPGGVRYTRDGSFTLNADRQLVTKQGLQVLDSAGQPITLPQGDLQIDTDGQIEVRQGDQSMPIAQIGLFEGRFSKVGGSLFDCSDATRADSATIRSGSVEGSNANPIDSMIAMIKLNRAFELAQRSVTQQDELNSKLVQSLNDR